MTRQGTWLRGSPLPPQPPGVGRRAWCSTLQISRKEGTIWMLVIILLNTVPQITTVTVLQTYATSHGVPE
jgi:hypothetical protein